MTKFSTDADVVVIDNASTDSSVQFITSNYPEIQVVQLDQNRGYAGGYNYGLKFLTHKHFVLLNSDVEVTESWLSPILDFYNTHENVGCIQPKILDLKNKNRFEYAGAAGGFIDKDLFAFCRGRILSELEEDNGQYDTATEVFWASGAALFITADLFEKAGGFDEDFFAHMEEIDLCWRLQNKGYTHYCVPSSKIYHLGGGTLSKQSSHKTYLNFRNNLYIITKNYAGNLLIKLAYRMVLDGVAAFRFLFRREFRNFWAVLKAHGIFYSNLSSLLRKRKVCLPEGDVKLKGMIHKSLIWSFFVQKKSKFSDLH